MILSGRRVLELNERYNLIEGLSMRESGNPEGIDLDLRVGRVERIVGSSYLGIEDRASAVTELVGDIKNGSKRIVMKPGDFFLVETMERINCPENPIVYEDGALPRLIIPDVRPRVSLQKGGIGLHCSTTNPGYNGPLWFGLSNNNRSDFLSRLFNRRKGNFEFELGARMFKVYWQSVIGNIYRPYSGQHQGGRITSQGQTEVQT